MSFFHPLLLGGLVLAGLPVLIHLLMRQKPRRIVFPALRFLQQGRKQTTRKLRLRHLLLLALRVFLIVLIVLALARPRIFRPDLGLQGDQPIAAILIFDTTPSMEYSVGGTTRLDDARTRARQLLDQLPADSRVAILDTADQVEEWSANLQAAHERIDDLRIVHARPRTRRANGTVTQQIAAAYRMFAKLQQDEGGEAPAQALFVFSDRTSACWNGNELKDLKNPGGHKAVFVDVGVSKPRDLAITGLVVANEHKVPQQSFLPGQTILFGVTVEAAAGASDAELLDNIVNFRLADEEKQWEPIPVTLRPGNHQVVWFKRQAAGKKQGVEAKGLQAGLYQAVAQLAADDDLPFDNRRFATFLVRDRRPVLVLADDPKDALYWSFDADWYKLFTCNVLATSATRDWTAADFAMFPVICMVNVANPSEALWEHLRKRVESGGGLVVVPGGETWTPKKDSYNSRLASGLLPGALESDEMTKLGAKEPGLPWQKDLPAHPLLKLFREWSADEKISFQQEGQEPRALGIWHVKPYEPGFVVVHYDDKEKTPAVLERSVGQGHVLMLTTPMDNSREARTGRAWNTYRQTVFSPIFVSLLLSHLAGESEEPNFSFLPGQPVPLAFPASSKALNFILSGPGLASSDAAVQRETKDQPVAEIDQAVTPGNYSVVELIETPGEPPRVNRFARFSINANPAEIKLDRVDVKEIEDQFGADSVVPLAYSDDLLERLQYRWPQSMEFLPYLMILLLLLLAAENLLSNLFYRPGAAIEPAKEAAMNDSEPVPARQPQEVA
jgi:hypothetical protein